MPIPVLLTQGLSNVLDAVQLVRAEMAADEFCLFAVGSDRFSPLAAAADRFVPEPSGLDDAAYINWLSSLCRDLGIVLLWPQSRLRVFFHARERLQTQGVQVLLPCLEEAVFALLDDKIGVARLLGDSIPQPYWREFRTAEEFDDARTVFDARLCIKPARSIYGQGFRILDDTHNGFAGLLKNDFWKISTADLKLLLTGNQAGVPFLLMEYLTGDERSIDCLARDGELLRCVVRRKPQPAWGRWQQIEENAQAAEIAATVCARFSLNGIVNIQTKERVLADGRREQCFLEVNPRMSGGIGMAGAGGLNLPYWVLRLALGTATAAAIPFVCPGKLVTSLQQPFALDLPLGSAWSGGSDVEDAKIAYRY